MENANHANHAAHATSVTTAGRMLCVLMLGACVATSGCISAVPKGALIGAGSGAVLGVGTGALISDDSLLGSRASMHKGDVTLAPGSTILASALIGAVFGGVVGAMIGKGAAKNEDASAAQNTAPRAF